MLGRRADASAFRAGATALRASATPVVTSRPSRPQSLALLLVLVLVAGGVAAASYLVHPQHSRAFDLLTGSVFLADHAAPVAVDLASGKATVRLLGAGKEVGTTDDSTDVQVAPATSATVLVNRNTGDFNMADQTGLVVRTNGGGVALHRLPGRTAAAAYPIQDAKVAGQSYILRTSPSRTDAYLIDEFTVRSQHKQVPAAGATVSGHTALGNGAVTAGRDLWLLTGTDGSRTVSSLTPPATAGAHRGLIRHGYGTVQGVSAIGAVTTGYGADAVTAVAVASQAGVGYYRTGLTRAQRTVPVAQLSDANQILPASDARDELAFLVRDGSGWYLVSLPVTGATASARPIVKPIHGIDATADLAAPAMSRGVLYTVNKGNGKVYAISRGGAVRTYLYPGAPTSGRFDDAYVIARGTRVFVDSVRNDYALALFTDDSASKLYHPIAKGAAVGVPASVNAEQLAAAGPGGGHKANKVNGKPQPKSIGQPVLTPPSTATSTPANPPSGSPAAGSPAAGRPVPGGPAGNGARNGPASNGTASCQGQTPHAPQVTGIDGVGARAAQVHWMYPAVGSQDCMPAGYVVHVRVTTPGAPAPAQGDVSVTQATTAYLTGLAPNTEYAVTVTANLGGRTATSPQTMFATTAEGPAAPVGLRVQTDSAGDWVLNWSGCGTSAGCVPVDHWTVNPVVCDTARGLVSAPQLTVPADPTAVAQPTAVYRGGDDLLGRGLQFAVYGEGASTGPGAPSALSPCLYSHRPADPSAMSLDASKPAAVAFGDSASTTVTLHLGAHPARAVGGIGATVSLALTGGGTTQQGGPFAFDGQQSYAATFAHVRPGTSYTATATVQPAHGEAAVTLPAVAVTTRSEYPTLSLDPTCTHPTDVPLQCALSLRIRGLASADANGETFDFGGTLRCGNVETDQFTRTAIDPADPLTGPTVSQLDHYYGPCTVAGTLTENARDAAPLLFGGLVIKLRADVDLGDPAVAGAGSSDFAVDWTASGAGAKVTYTGTADQLGKLTANWTEKVLSPAGDDCSNPDGAAAPGPQDAVEVAISTECLAKHGADPGWQVQISYDDAVTGDHHGPFTLNLPGNPPSYQFCDVPADSVTAQWGATVADGVALSRTGEAGRIAGCSKWQYSLLDQSKVACPSPDQAPSGPPPVTVPVTCTTAPDGGWTVQISYVDSAGDSQTLTVPVGGTPPPPP